MTGSRFEREGGGGEGEEERERERERDKDRVLYVDLLEALTFLDPMICLCLV